MGGLAERNVVALLDDEPFIDELIQAILNDPSFREVVADDAAVRLEALISDDPKFHHRLAEDFLSDRKRRREVLHRFADNFS